MPSTPWVAALLLGAIALGSEASAQTLTIPFTGRVTSFQVVVPPGPGLTVAPGDSVAGQATIQLGSANAIVSLPTVTSYSHPTDTLSIATRIGPHLWVTSASGSSLVRNDDPAQGDVLSMSSATFGGPFFAGADNGLQSLRWEDASAPFELLGSPTLPAAWSQVEPAAATVTRGVISGGTWILEFEIETSPILMTRVDDSVPEAPRVHFELTAPASAVSIALGTLEESTGPLPAGAHHLQLNVPRTIAPANYQVVATATTASGMFDDTANFDARWLPEASETSTSTVVVPNIGARLVHLRGALRLQRWEWSLPGGTHDRYVRETSLGITSNLPADKTITGGNPFLRHVVIPSATVNDTLVRLTYVAGIGAGTFWSASFGSDRGVFARSGTQADFRGLGGTFFAGGYSPWNLGLTGLGVTVQVN